MEIDRNGRIAARRSLQAMAETQDIETRRALWRCAVKYAGKGRGTGAGECAPIPLAARGRGC